MSALAVPPETWSVPASAAARAAEGREVRRRLPRSALAHLADGPRDPLGILDRQNATRVPELVPLRRERMSASPFAFYRGTAALQAADFAGEDHSGILVPSCGDAHVANFGFYGSRQRRLVFDLNDFDEAAWAPWEWDVKRLVASIVVAGQSTSRDDRVIGRAVRGAVRTYARGMGANPGQNPLVRFFAHFDVNAVADTLDRQTRAVVKRAVRDAAKRTGDRASRRLTTTGDDGRLVFVEQAPTMTHPADEAAIRLRANVDRYARSASVDIRVLLTNYVVSDLVRRVVGVGSVGTVCSLVLFQDGDGNALILQAKEAGRSVLEEYGGIAQPAAFHEHVQEHGQGGRVVALQRILQATSDPFLGQLRASSMDFYVRQFHDMKGGIEVAEVEDRPFHAYAEACAATLARAHAQSPSAPVVAGYLGSGRVAGEALAEWAYAYADRSRADYEAFVAAA